MRATNRRILGLLFGLSVRPLFLIVLLAACSDATGPITTDRISSYRVEPIADNGNYDFEEYLQFAEEEVARINPTARLYSTSRATPCSSVDRTMEQNVVDIGFLGTALYYLWPHPIWYQVWIETQPEPATIINGYVDTSRVKKSSTIIDKSKLNVDYATALRIARERGGTDFEQQRTTCQLVVELSQNQWLFSYMSDDTPDEQLKVCVDATSGDPCPDPPAWWLGNSSSGARD